MHIVVYSSLRMYSSFVTSCVMMNVFSGASSWRIYALGHIRIIECASTFITYLFIILLRHVLCAWYVSIPHLSIQIIHLYNTYQFILDPNMVHSVYRISNDELDRLILHLYVLQFDIYTIHLYNTYRIILDLNIVHSVVHSVFIATPSTMCDVSIHRLFIH